MIKEILQKELLDSPFSGEDQYILHVTSLVYCSEQKKQYVGNPYPAIHGKLIHKAIQTIMSRYQYIPEYPVIYHNKSPLVDVYGHVDLYDPSNNVPIEIKTSSSFDIQHAIQLNIYMYLTHAKKGILIYVSTKAIHECTVMNDSVTCDDMDFSKGQVAIELPHVDEDFMRKLIYDYMKGKNIGHLNQCEYCHYMGCSYRKIIDIQ